MFVRMFHLRPWFLVACLALSWMGTVAALDEPSVQPAAGTYTTTQTLTMTCSGCAEIRYIPSTESSPSFPSPASLLQNPDQALVYDGSNKPTT